MAAASYFEQVQKIYIAFYQRPADPAGLLYWSQRIDVAGGDMSAVINAFADSAEAEALYGTIDSDSIGDVIDALYAAMFNRPADEAGKAWYIEQFEAGNITAGEIALAVLEGAKGDDAVAIANKVKVANEFTQQVDGRPLNSPDFGTGTSFNVTYDADDVEAAREILAEVTSSPATVLNSSQVTEVLKDKIANPEDPINAQTGGQIFTLTTDADNLTGTNADDTFDAPLGAAAGGLVSQQTLQGFDKLDGGEGNDTLNAELNGFDSVIGAHNPTITNIEQYNLTVSADGAAGGLDLARASGYEVLQNINSRGDLTLDNVNLTDGEAPTIALTNVRAGTTTNVNYDTEVGAIETQNVEVSNVGSEDGNVALFIDTDGDGIGTLNLTASNGTNLFFDVDAGGVETLNLDVADGVELVLNDDADGIENLNITGQDELALEGTADFENLVNLNSEEYTGDLELNISGSEVLESVLTGDGDDVITADVDNFGDITTPTTVDLGQGENRLILRDGFSISAGELSSLDFTVNTVDNAQTLELVNVVLNGTASLGLDGVSALETLELRNFDSNGNDLSINGGPDDLTINAISNFTPAADFDMEGGELTVNGVRNLVVNTGDDLAIDGGLKGHTLETLELNAADDATLTTTTGFNVNGELDALTSIEVNAGVAEGASNSDAYVRIDDTNGSLTTGLTALESISVTAQDDATLILNGTNNALAGAQAALEAAEAAQADAVTDLANAQAAQTAAETALTIAQDAQDAAVIAQDAAEAAQIAAQGVYDAAELAQIAAQADFDAALAADTAADAAVTAAQEALNTAQHTVDTFYDYLADFSFDVGFLTSAQNISNIKTYILANNDLTTAQKNELIDLVPTSTFGNPQPFNSLAEFNAYLADALAFLETDYDIAGLTNDVNGAVAAAVVTQDDLDAANAALIAANDALATATTVLGTANDALAAADADLLAADAAVAAATDALLDAVVEVDHAEHALDDADAAVIAAQAAVDAALDQGTGFEALHTVTVEATDGDADVELTDVYGAVSLDVTAADNAWIDLFNTKVTSVTATAAHVDIDVAGDTVGNSALTSITVTAVSADITLEDNVSGFKTLDVVNVSDDLVVDTSGADFGSLALGEFITYEIGATTDVDFTTNVAREVFRFVADDIGDVLIRDFTSGADPVSGDRIDLSDFGYTGTAQLVFQLGEWDDVAGTWTNGGAETDVRIFDLNGGPADFSGSITVVGVGAADLAEFQANNMIFA